MKKKLLNALRTSYADKGLSQEELEGLANIISQNLSEDASENDINNAVSGVSGYVSIMQKFGDKRANAIENKYHGWIKPEPKPNPQPKPNENVLTREQVSEMLKNGIAEAIKPFQEAEKNKRMAQILSSQSNLKGIPQKFINRYKLEKEEDAESLASQIEQDYAEERKEILKSMGISEVPPIGNNGPDSDDDFLKKMQDAQKALAPNPKD